jgi:flagellar biogenesis protein FliO
MLLHSLAGNENVLLLLLLLLLFLLYLLCRVTTQFPETKHVLMQYIVSSVIPA